MKVRIFKITGKFRVYNVKRWQNFEMYLREVDEKNALEKLYSLLGGNHKVKRHLIKIEKIEEVDERYLQNNPKAMRKVK